MLKNPTVLKYIIFILIGIILVLAIAVIYLAFKKNEYYVCEDKDENDKDLPKASETAVLELNLDVTDDEEKQTKVVPHLDVSPKIVGLKCRISVQSEAREQEITKFPCVIGRDNTADFVLHDAAISRRHCCLYLQEETFYLEDISEHNGTFLNGVKLVKHKAVALSINDEIVLGHVKLTIQEIIKS